MSRENMYRDWRGRIYDLLNKSRQESLLTVILIILIISFYFIYDYAMRFRNPEYYDIPQNIVIYSRILWYTSEYYDVPRNIMIYPRILWYTPE
jgi:hypothetical protein